MRCRHIRGAADSRQLRCHAYLAVKDTLDVMGHYSLPLGQLVLYSIGVVLGVFIICNVIDQLRIATLEKWFFNWYDQKLSSRMEKIVNEE